MLSASAVCRAELSADTVVAPATVRLAPAAIPAATEPPCVTTVRVASMPMSKPPEAPVDLAAAVAADAGCADVAATSRVAALIVPPAVAETTGVTSIVDFDTPTAPVVPALKP